MSAGIMVEMLVERGLPVHLAKRYLLIVLRLMPQLCSFLGYLLRTKRALNCAQKVQKLHKYVFICKYSRVLLSLRANAGSIRKFAKVLRCTTSGARPSQQGASTSAKAALRCPATAPKLARPKV